MTKKKNITIPIPNMQIDFSFALGQMRELYLQEAIGKTLEDISIRELDKDLSDFVHEKSLQALAKYGLRGEFVFPVPLLLKNNPRLLGYYRLLLGFSQKEFYSNQFGTAKFKTMETKGVISPRLKDEIDELCRAMIASLSELIDGIGINRVTPGLLDDLTLLTVGPQLRGGANVKKGQAGIIDVFKAINEITEKHALNSAANKIEIRNSSGRIVLIEFAPDPDIVIKEFLSAGTCRNTVAIEVKGGSDFSNIHNRIGEAEKSHQKAKANGFIECWTVVNVDGFDETIAKRESPTTNRFYRLSSLREKRGVEYTDFKNQISAIIGIR